MLITSIDNIVQLSERFYRQDTTVNNDNIRVVGLPAKIEDGCMPNKERYNDSLPVLA